jgi:hypothetical protein
MPQVRKIPYLRVALVGLVQALPSKLQSSKPLARTSVRRDHEATVNIQ